MVHDPVYDTVNAELVLFAGTLDGGEPVRHADDTPSSSMSLLYVF
jgi:hypothetical protein